MYKLMIFTCKGFSLVVPHRRFVRELDVLWLEGNYETCSNAPKEGHMFLFNDLVVFCGKDVDKHGHWKVSTTQALEGICFVGKDIRDGPAVCLHYNATGSSFTSIWPQDNKVKLLKIFNSIRTKPSSGEGRGVLIKTANSLRSRSSLTHSERGSTSPKFITPHVPRSSSAIALSKVRESQSHSKLSTVSLPNSGLVASSSMDAISKSPVEITRRTSCPYSTVNLITNSPKRNRKLSSSLVPSTKVPKAL